MLYLKINGLFWFTHSKTHPMNQKTDVLMQNYNNYLKCTFFLKPDIIEMGNSALLFDENIFKKKTFY